MRVYEYAKKRDIISKEVVDYVKSKGYPIKNHMAKIPDGLMDELDGIEFTVKPKKKKRNPKTIALISMECTPFISTGLGALVGNKVAQYEVADHNVAVILPKYNIKHELIYHSDIQITIGNNDYDAAIYKLTNNNITYFFIENDYYFNREKLYGFYDDAERFAFMSRASLAIINNINLEPDIINAHDWTQSLIPLLYKDSANENNEIKTPTLELSIYGATYQGIYEREVLTSVFGLGEQYFNSGLVEYAGSLNMLKAGLVTADKLDINKVALEDLKRSYLKEFV